MIGIFDSGYGGLTILEPIRRVLPQYDYIYLGDNARAPYGTRSFPVIYEYTLQAVRHLFAEGCRLVVLACNTASAKALRTIQMHDIRPETHRVLGVIRPTVEAVYAFNRQRGEERHIGILATPGTVSSRSYVIELMKQWELDGNKPCVVQQACPMWVPLIESGEHLYEGADFFVDKYLRLLFDQDRRLDTVVLACTHYPLLWPKIQALLPRYTDKDVHVVSQGQIVANSLKEYLQRHPEIEKTCSKGGQCRFLTTEQPDKFVSSASLFLNEKIEAEHIDL